MRWLVWMAVAAGALFGVVMLTVDATDRSDLWVEVGKGLIELIAVGLVGAAIKLAVEAHQARRRAAELRDEFRKDKYRRIVDVTSSLRRVSVNVVADSSTPVWSDELRTVLDADAALRAIKHEIYTTIGVADAPFREPQPIVDDLEAMYGYTTWLVQRFAEALAERAPREPQSGPAPTAASAPRWVQDMRAPAPSAEAGASEQSWSSYERAETRALRQIVAESLGST